MLILNFAILPSLQQFNKVLVYEVRMLMTDQFQQENGTLLEAPTAFRNEIYRELGISLYTNPAAEESDLRWAARSACAPRSPKIPRCLPENLVYVSR